MKKQEEEQKQDIYELEDFEKYAHLWNIVPGGSGKGVVLLRNIVDSIQADKHDNPNMKLPSIILAGKNNTGKNLVAKALVNSLMCQDVRECPGQYFENGIYSSQFFNDSYSDTAYIIYNIEYLNKMGQSVLWRYLKQGFCKYYNYVTKDFTATHQCNGIIVMTTNSTDKLPQPILDAIDYIVELEPYTAEQLESIVHQILTVFLKIDYTGKQVLMEVVEMGGEQISIVIDFLKICIMILKSEMKDCLTMEIVEKAKRFSCSPVPPPPVAEDDIPF